MISLVLILPVVLCILLSLFKNNTLNSIVVAAYAFVHFILGLSYFIKPDIMQNNQYFCLNAANIVFYLVLSIVFILTALYNIGYSKNLSLKFDRRKMTLYSIMILTFVFSMTGAVLSDNLGLSWIFIEGTTLASAYLIYFDKTKHSIEAAWKYVFICSIGIALAFVGIILLTIAEGSLDSLNYVDLMNSAANFNHFWMNVSFVFILFGIGTKMGLAPVHFWLPDAHAEAPSPISALLSATLLNCAFLIILNVYKIMIAANCIAFARIMLLTMGFLSLFITSVFLYHTNNYKRMLAYSSIENMGILAIAASLGGIAYYALILHLIGHSFAKASFFLTSGNILELFQTKKIKSVHSIISYDKKTAWLWMASFLGICAFPPGVLFVSEFLIVKAFIIQKHFILCALFLFLLTVILFGMGKAVINMVFGEKNKEKEVIVKQNVSKITAIMYLPQFVLLAMTFILGIYIPKVLDVVIRCTIG